MEIKILNFEKFNPRKDRARHHWFRVENDISFSKDLFGLNPGQRWFWIFLLSLASKSQKNEIDFELEYLSIHSGLNIKQTAECLKLFEKRSMISITGYQSVTNRGQTVSYITLHNSTEHNEHNNNAQIPARKLADSAFEDLYEKYPRKVGKTRGIAKLKASIKTEDDVASFIVAVTNYRAHLAKEGTEAKYIMHFSTFVNCWPDWLDPENGKTEKIEKPKRDFSFLLEAK